MIVCGRYVLSPFRNPNCRSAEEAFNYTRAESGIKEKFDCHGGERPMLDLRHVYSLTDFLRNHKEMVARVTETKKPIVLTVKGKPALVIQDADSYQELLDRLNTTNPKQGD